MYTSSPESADAAEPSHNDYNYFFGGVPAIDADFDEEWEEWERQQADNANDVEE